MWIGCRERTPNSLWAFNKAPITSRDIEEFVLKKAANLLDTLASLDADTSSAVRKHVEVLQEKLLAIHVRRKRSFGVKIKSIVASMDFVTEKDTTQNVSDVSDHELSKPRLTDNERESMSMAKDSSLHLRADREGHCSPTLPKTPPERSGPSTYVMPPGGSRQLERYGNPDFGHERGSRAQISGTIHSYSEGQKDSSAITPASYVPNEQPSQIDAGKEQLRKDVQPNYQGVDPLAASFNTRTSSSGAEAEQPNLTQQEKARNRSASLAYTYQMENTYSSSTVSPSNLSAPSVPTNLTHYSQSQYNRSKSAYTSLPMTSSSWGWQQQPQSFPSRVSVPAQSPYPYGNSMSTWMQESSPGTSRAPSITSTGSQAMSAEQMYSMQSAYSGMGYTPQPAFANPNQYNL